MTIAQQLEQKGFEKGMEQGIQQGIEQGIEQGCKEKALQIARLLLQKGVSQTLISETTGISTDELTPLQQ
ncbi:hypothetical protein [Kalamiella sp. sgz302252]|uniref:hypothetical protein n=1 Tax=Pantoea sp. sgz302252 TaxID=3341827 RepID=UPI0036D39E46